MIVQCPKCLTRYRIAGEKLPDDGGKIRCPGCRHAFFVRRDSVKTKETKKPERRTRSSSSRSSRASKGSAPLSSDGWDFGSSGLGFAADAGTVDSGLFNRSGFGNAAERKPSSRTTAPTPMVPPEVSKPSNELQSWKLRNAIGLILDFSDTQSLKRWLQSRDSFDNITVSSDNGENWSSIVENPVFAGIKATGRKTIMGMAALSPPRSAISTSKTPTTRSSAIRSSYDPGKSVNPLALTSKEVRNIFDPSSSQLGLRAQSSSQLGNSDPTQTNQKTQPRPSKPVNRPKQQSVNSVTQPIGTNSSLSLEKTPPNQDQNLSSSPDLTANKQDMQAQARARVQAKRDARATQKTESKKNKKLESAQYKRIKQNKKEQNPLLLFSAAFAMFVLIGIFLQIFGVIQVGSQKKQDEPVLITPSVEPTLAVSNEVSNAQIERVHAQVLSHFESADRAAQSGNYGDAVSHLIRARRLEPENRDIHCRLADAHRQAGQEEQAAEARDRCRGR